MNEQEKAEFRAQVEKEVRTEIAEKMRQDGLEPERIYRYTGIQTEVKKIADDTFDAVARQVAAEMLMRGMPIESIQIATQLPYEVVKELKDQFASFFGGDEDTEENPGPPAW